MARVPTSEQTRKWIAEVLRGDFDKSALLRNSVRYAFGERAVLKRKFAAPTASCPFFQQQ